MASDTGGVRPMAIAGRTVNQRERLLGMTDKERAWRAQWLKDQILSPNEPRSLPEVEKMKYNPIRRFYRYPLDTLASKFEPTYGIKVQYIRYFTGKFGLFVLGSMIAVYYFKYNMHDWTRMGGWRVLKSRESVLPGDPGYPKVSDRSKPSDYAASGFDKVTLNL